MSLPVRLQFSLLEAIACELKWGGLCVFPILNESIFFQTSFLAASFRASNSASLEPFREAASAGL